MPHTEDLTELDLVYRTVIGWLASAVNLPQTSIDVSRKFRETPPDGYGLDQGRFLKMCDDITAALNSATARTLDLPTAWCLQHEGDEIGKFINAVAEKLIAST